MSNKTCFTTKEANMLIINPIEPKAKRLILGIEWEILKESD